MEFRNSFIKDLKFCNREIVIIGIGNSKINGDAFGPMVGEILKDEYNVVGNMRNNVNYNNLEYHINRINRRYNNPYIITIDSAISNVLKIRRCIYK